MQVYISRWECDWNCGTESDEFYSADEMPDGWMVVNGEDLCPTCAEAANRFFPEEDNILGPDIVDEDGVGL